MEDYIVIEKWDIKDLLKEVNSKCKESYTPLGGISIVYAGFSCMYYQAMTKNKA